MSLFHFGCDTIESFEDLFDALNKGWVLSMEGAEEEVDAEEGQDDVGCGGRDEVGIHGEGSVKACGTSAGEGDGDDRFMDGAADFVAIGGEEYFVNGP